MNGHRAPYPSADSLPPGEACRCKCSSVPATEAAYRAQSQVPPIAPKPPVPPKPETPPLPAVQEPIRPVTAKEAREEAIRIEREMMSRLEDNDKELRRLSRRQNEIIVAGRAATTDEEMIALDSELDLVHRAIKPLRAEAATIKKEALTEWRKVLAQSTKGLPQGILHNLDKPVQAVVRQGVKEFGRMLPPGEMTGRQVLFLPVPANATHGPDRAYYANGPIHLPERIGDEAVRTVVHECGHLWEDVNPEVHRRALTFLSERTAGEAARPLNDIVGMVAYAPTEVARKDRFITAYVGKDYGGSATEVVSTGLEFMWAEPARLARKDAGHFDLIWELLHPKATP